MNKKLRNEVEKSLVVGIGASAGGLEAFSEFLQSLGDAPGLAIVFVQHLDPNSNTLLPNLLKPKTALSVLELTKRTPIKPNTIYICPPQTLLEIRNGALLLVDEENEQRQPSPIDHFFHALAESEGERGIGIILSGSGSDGTLGLKSISDCGGMTFAQDAESARFDSMPRNAATTGVADHVLPPAAIASELLKYVAFLGQSSEQLRGKPLRDSIAEAIPDIADRLLQETNHDFQHYKSSTLCRRIQRRMQLLKIAHVADYVERIQHDAEEAHTLFRELLIGVTAFFRDPESFQRLSEEVIPKLFKNRMSDDPVRIWIPGCATGEEAYTIAILCREYLDSVRQAFQPDSSVRQAFQPDPSATSQAGKPDVLPKFQIFASDIDERALSIARQGIYPAGIADHVSEARLKRFFIKKGKRYHVNKEIRETVLFSPHNLISDPPFSRQDLISCRNLLIYLGPHLQKKLIPLFHFALRPNGFLFLGPSESITSHGDLFRPVDARHRLSQRKGTAIGRAAPLEMRTPSGGLTRPPGSSPFDDDKSDIVQIMQRIVLDEFSPKSVVVDEEGQVICSSAETSKYLTIGEGAYQNNILKMARQGLRIGLRATLQEAKSKRRRVTHENLSVQTVDGKQRVMLTVQPMMRLGEDSGLFMVVFHDVGLPIGLSVNESDESDANHARASLDRQADAMIEQLERELQTTRDDLEKTMQEMETANEELKSSNEELLSMNEELQSANEELETSKEEIRASSEAVGRVNTDLENLLRSTRIATIFLDDDLCIRSFTPAATEIYSLIATDAGRPLTQIVPSVHDMPPLPDATALDPNEPVAHTVTAHNGRTYIRRVLPYQDEQGESNGLVVTFTDVSDLEESRRRLQTFTDAVPPLMAIVDRNQRFIFVNEAYAKHWQRRTDEIVGCTIAEIVSEEAYQKIAPQMQKALAGEQVRYELVLHRRGTNQLVYEEVIYVPQLGRDGEVEAVHVVITDQTELRSTRADLISRQQQLDLALEAGRLGTWNWDVRSDQVTWSRHIYDIFGYTHEQFDNTQSSFLNVVHPDDRDHVGRVIQQTFAERRKEYEVEFRVIRPDNGQIVWSYGQGIVEYSDDGQPIKLTGTSSDVTERKRRELNLAFLESLQAAFNPQLSSHELIALTCTKLAHHLQLSRCAFAEVDEDASTANVICDHNAVGTESMVGVKQITDFHTPQEQQDFIAGRLVGYDNVAEEVSDPKRRASFEAAGIESVCNTAFVSDQRIKFILAGHKNQPYHWLTDEKELIRETAQRLCVRVERARAEQELAEAKARLELSLEVSNVATWSWNMETNGVLSNPALNRMYGFEPHEKLTLADFVDQMDEAVRTRVTDAIDASVKQGLTYDQEYPIRLRTGELRHVRAVGKVQPARTGNPREFFGVVLDVTDRRQRELDTARREQFLQLALDAGRMGTFHWDVPSGRVTWSESIYAMYGCEQSDFGGHVSDFASLVHPEDRDAVMAKLETEFASDSNEHHIQFRLIRVNDGRTIWVDGRGLIRRDDEGKPLDVTGVAHDITEQKQREVDLVDREAHLRRVINNQLGLVGVIGRDGTLLEVDDRSLSIAGLTRDDVIGKHFAECAWWTYDKTVQQQMRDAMARAFAGEVVRYDVPLYAAGLDGPDARLMIDFMMAPVFSDDGEVEYLIPSGVDIRERHAFERRLRESESRFRTMTDGLPLVIWLHDAEGKLLSVNRAYCEFFGVEEEDMHDMKWHELVHPDDFETYAGEFTRCVADRCDFHAEVRVKRADGLWRWLESWGQPRFSDSGEYLGHIGASADVTDRREALEKLEDSRQRLTMAMESARMGSFWWEPETDHCDWDDQWYDALGVSRDVEKTGKTFFNLIHPEDRDVVNEATRRALEGDGIYKVEFRTIDQHGHDRWIAGNGRIIPGQADHPTRLVGLNWDITDAKNNEQQVRLNEQRLLTAAEAAGFGMVHADLISGRMYLSEQMLRLIGRSTSEPQMALTDQAPEWVHPDDRAACRKHFEQLQRMPEDATAAIDHRIIRPDGEVRWVHLQGKPLYDTVGNKRRITQVLGTVVDITERRLYEAALEESRRAAESASASKSEFLANMSHEIRTPMTAILGYADLLREMVERDDAQQYLQTIRRNGDYLLEIINDILDLSKIEAGKFDIDEERFEPHRLIEDVRSIMEVRAAEGGLELEVVYDARLPRVIHSDAKRLKQILINLVGNAIKFTRQGNVSVRVYYDASQGWLFFEVRDTGVGMTKEQQVKLFLPFSQGDSSVSRNFGGTGLGLAISQRLAEMLGGRITMTSERGIGSTFTLSVAVKNPADAELVNYDDATHPQTTENPVEAKPVRLDCHVLVVDDRRDIRFLSQHILTKAGATVEECEDGQLAVDRIAAGITGGTLPDIILLDMQMPNLDGYQTARKLRELGYDRPIIALTADAMQGDMNQCLKAGCNDYLSKPIDAVRLVNLVGELT